jgi:hypothetical protein
MDVLSARSVLLCGASALAIAAAGPARADVYTASTSFTAGSNSPGGFTLSLSNTVNIYPSDSDPAGNNVFGHVYGGANNVPWGSRSSGQGTYTITGTFDGKTSLTNTSTSTIDYVLDFLITEGQLAVMVPPGATGSQSASLTVSLLEDGVSKFGYSSSMSVSGPTATPMFTESGATLNPAGATKSSGNGYYSWGDYIGSVDLGFLAPSQTVTLEFTATSMATGTSPGGCQQTSNGYGGFNCAGLGYGLARFGDPNSANGGGPFVAFVPGAVANPVPEPAALAALGAGLAALTGLRRARRA